MRLVLTRSLWGLEDDPGRYHEALPTVAAAGYDAVTCPVQLLADDDAFAGALADAGLGYLPQVFTFGRTVEDHLAMLDEALGCAARFEPMHALSQLGRDGWPLDESTRFLRDALVVAERHGVPLAVETHRTRSLYSPWVLADVLEAVPGLRLSADLSHWTCVAESIDLPSTVIDAVAGAACHVDARVGHEEGPQVPDPRVPAAAGHLERFESWWDRCWQVRSDAGDEAMTIAPEFGPPPYQPIDPATGEPLADIDELNDWMAVRLRRRYG